MAAKKNPDDGLVSVRLNRIPGRGADQSQFVAVNGRSWLVKRGEWVQLPGYVARVLEESQRRRDRAEDMMAKLSSV